MKDIQADILALCAAVVTLRVAIARQCYEPAQLLAEIAAINAELDQLGITLETGPRRWLARRRACCQSAEPATQPCHLLRLRERDSSTPLGTLPFSICPDSAVTIEVMRSALRAAILQTCGQGELSSPESVCGLARI
jgi:hypothetical protein